MSHIYGTVKGLSVRKTITNLSLYSDDRLSRPTEGTHAIVNDNQSRKSPPRVRMTLGRQGCRTATVEGPSRRDGNVQRGVRRRFTIIQNKRPDVAGSVTNDRACSDCGTAVEGGYKGAFGIRDEYEGAPKRVDRVKAAGIVRVGKKSVLRLIHNFLAMLHKCVAQVRGYHQNWWMTYRKRYIGTNL